jgi:hypothetical protein
MAGRQLETQVHAGDHDIIVLRIHDLDAVHGVRPPVCSTPASSAAWSHD